MAEKRDYFRRLVRPVSLSFTKICSRKCAPIVTPKRMFAAASDERDGAHSEDLLA